MADDRLFGFVHFMSFPEVWAAFRAGDAKPLLASVERSVRDERVGAVELAQVSAPAVSEKISRMARETGTVVVAGAQPLQLGNAEKLDPCDICCLDAGRRTAAVRRLKTAMKDAADMGATKFGLVSGKDPVIASGASEDRAGEIRRRARGALVESLVDLCEFAADLNLDVALETFDRVPNPKGCSGFKGLLIGPAGEAVEVAKAVRAAGCGNFALMYDSSHMRLLGEDVDALEALGPYLGHAHVGNSVSNPVEPAHESLRGDSHPPFGIHGSDVDFALLRAYLGALDKADYSGIVSFEVKPLPGQNPERVFEETWEFVQKAAGNA